MTKIEVKEWTRYSIVIDFVDKENAEKIAKDIYNKYGFKVSMVTTDTTIIK